MKKIPLGVIIISVAMFFAAFAIDIFWLAKLVGKAFPTTMPIDPAVYNAFAVPDIVLSFFLYIGAYGLLKLRKYGFMASLVAMGMWLFDSLLVLAITKSSGLHIIGPNLFFVFYLFFVFITIIYLWVKKELFD